MRLIAGLATLLSVLCFATGVSAHAELVSTEPGDGSMLASAPTTVQLHFNESVTPAVVSLIDAEGKARDDAMVRSAGETIVITLPKNLPRGTQVVSYRVISQDGHPVAGAMVFSIGAATTTAANVGADKNRIGQRLDLAGTDRPLSRAVRRRRRGGSLVPGSRRARRLDNDRHSAGCRSFQRAGVAGLQGLDVLGLPLRDIFAFAPWKAALATSLGPSLLVAIAALAAGFFAQRSTSVSVARVLSAIAIAGVGVSLAASGHAATSTAAVADPADGVSAWRRRRLLGRRADAVGGDGVAAGRWAAGRCEPVFTRGGAGRGRAGAGRAWDLRSSSLRVFAP